MKGKESHLVIGAVLIMNVVTGTTSAIKGDIVFACLGFFTIGWLLSYYFFHILDAYLEKKTRDRELKEFERVTQFIQTQTQQDFFNNKDIKKTVN